MAAKWPWVKNPGSSAVWTLDLPRLPAVSSLPAGRVSFCSATATLELFHLLPWYSTTAWDGRMQLPRGSLTPKTDFDYHKTGLRSADAGFCYIWHLYLQVGSFVRHRPTINRAAVLQDAATGLSRATEDGRHPSPDPITVPVPVSGPGSLVPIRSINGVRYTAHALHKQVPGIAARPLILQDHQPQIRLLLVITLLRNNRHTCMPAREVWLVVQIFATPKASFSLRLSLLPCARCEFACDGPTTRPSAHMGFPNNAIPRPAGICIECHVDGSTSTSSPSWRISSVWLYFKQSIICEYAPASWLCRGRPNWFTQACHVRLPGPGQGP